MLARPAQRRKLPWSWADTYTITLIGSVSIPGAKTPAQYSPLTISTHQTTPDLVLTTPLPSFNIADKTDRWTYITHDTLPAYQRILHDYPTTARQIIASPIKDRVAHERLGARWPQLATQLVTGWHLSSTFVGDTPLAPKAITNPYGGVASTPRRWFGAPR